MGTTKRYPEEVRERAVHMTSQLDWLSTSMRSGSHVRMLEAGEALFRQGTRATAIFEVEQGQLRMIRHVDHRPVVLHTAKSGELFAEAALFVPVYLCDAVAAVASRIRVYPKRQVLAIFRSDPALGERFMSVLSHQIHGLRAQLEERNIRSARERLLHRLALAAGPDGRTMHLDGTLMDLASEIGLTHEVLYRTLADLESEGVISRTRSTIILRKANRI